MPEFILEMERQNDVIEPCRGVARIKETGKITAWRRQRRRPSGGGFGWRPTNLCPLAQLLGKPCMPFLIFGGSKLHGEIEEAFFVTFGVTLDKPY
ncbi:hypothetical protein [Rhizobium sp. NXC14]|uniref:hypothetical protein n=1 Tax=Rhizobium sp. NXC14 TaxID=1981173 RepID=UPI001FD93490|nr:hypothetical protein [Rhizobium sp. NXC14]